MKQPVLIVVILALFVTSCAQSKSADPMTKSAPVDSVTALRTGAECMERYLPLLEGKRVALCGNQTSVVGNTHLVDTLLARKVNLVKLFCPEHGFRGQAEAGATIASGKDPLTGLPVVSLYGKNKKPTAEQLQDIDILLFDLQDVGCRFYTYISTLHYVMEAAAENHIKVILMPVRRASHHSLRDHQLLADAQHVALESVHLLDLGDGRTERLGDERQRVARLHLVFAVRADHDLLRLRRRSRRRLRCLNRLDPSGEVLHELPYRERSLPARGLSVSARVDRIDMKVFSKFIYLIDEISAILPK